MYCTKRLSKLGSYSTRQQGPLQMRSSALGFITLPSTVELRVMIMSSIQNGDIYFFFVLQVFSTAGDADRTMPPRLIVLGSIFFVDCCKTKTI